MKEEGPFCKFVASCLCISSRQNYYIFTDILWMQMFIDIEYLLCAQIVSFHLLSVNYHRKGPVLCKTVNPYHLNYINATDFHSGHHYLGVIDLESHTNLLSQG